MKKKTIITLIVLLILSITWYTYYQYDKENLKIDYYNFQQLEKAKEVVERFEKSWERFPLPVHTLYDFNYGYTWDFKSWFEANIHPLNNTYCYDVYYDRNPTWPWYVFTFWFKLHSKLFKLFNWWEYYKYPNWVHKSKPSKQCKKEMEISSKLWWYTWIPSCAWLNADYYDYMEAVNNPCKKQ